MRVIKISRLLNYAYSRLFAINLLFIEPDYFSLAIQLRHKLQCRRQSFKLAGVFCAAKNHFPIPCGNPISDRHKISVQQMLWRKNRREDIHIYNDTHRYSPKIFICSLIKNSRNEAGCSSAYRPCASIAIAVTLFPFSHLSKKST